MTEQKSIISYVLRAISAVYVVCVIIPMYLVTLIVGAVFELLNGFTYENFRDETFTGQVFEKVPMLMQYGFLVKIYILVITPIFRIPFSFYQAVKQIKF